MRNAPGGVSRKRHAGGVADGSGVTGKGEEPERKDGGEGSDVGEGLVGRVDERNVVEEDGGEEGDWGREGLKIVANRR